MYTVVTGGAGFIGSNVIKELNDRGIDKIIVVDNLGSSDKWKNLVGKRFSDLIHKSDLFQWLVDGVEHVSHIIHLGACSNTVETDAQYLLENNYRYSRKLATIAHSRNIRFLYASSAATYGNGQYGFSDDHELLGTFKPLNMYGYSKHLFDLWVQKEGLLDRFIGLKYFNVFGPNEWHKGRMASALIKMTSQAVEKGKITLFSSHNDAYADGEQKRDFVYVKDVARITCDLLFSDITGIYNVGRGEASSWNRLAQAVFQALSLPKCIEYVPMPEDLQGKYQYFTQAEVKKIQGALGQKFSPTSLEEAVDDYVNSHLLAERVW